jgi:hypothetical protein
MIERYACIESADVRCTQSKVAVKNLFFTFHTPFDRE